MLSYVVSGSTHEKWQDTQSKINDQKYSVETYQDQANQFEQMLKKDARVFQSHLQNHFENAEFSTFDQMKFSQEKNCNLYPDSAVFSQMSQETNVDLNNNQAIEQLRNEIHQSQYTLSDIERRKQQVL